MTNSKKQNSKNASTKYILNKEIKYFEHHREELLRNYKGQFILIKDSQQIGIYSSIEEALAIAASMFGLESFLVREIQKEESKESIPALSLGIIYGFKPAHSRCRANY